MILVTGGTGFLGSYLLYNLFLDSKKVRAFKREQSKFDQLKIAFSVMNKNPNVSFDDFINSIEWVNVDLLDTTDIENNLDGIDEIYHLAAFVSFNRKNRENIIKTNIGGTSNLINLCLKCGIKKFHYASSIASLNRNDDNIISEKNDVSDKKFSTTYSKSKYLSEMEVWRAYNEGLEGVIVNPGVILGPAIRTHDSIRAFKTIQAGFGFYPKGKNGFVDVRDTAELFYKLSQNPEYYNQRYLLVAESVSYFDLFTWMSGYFKVKGPKRRANKQLSYLISYVDSIRCFISSKDPIISQDLVKLVNSDYIFDNSKVKSAIDFDFRPVKETIKDTCEFLLKANS